jgi:hypothetical protein
MVAIDTKHRSLIFLGGTSGRNRWRESFMRRLADRGVPRGLFFDPVVKDWNEQARQREEEVKRDAALLVFYLGNPQEPDIPLSAFALVEATLAVCTQPKRTLLVFDLDGLEGHARKVYEQTYLLLRAQNVSVPIFHSIDDAESWIVERFGATRG